MPMMPPATTSPHVQLPGLLSFVFHVSTASVCTQATRSHTSESAPSGTGSSVCLLYVDCELRVSVRVVLADLCLSHDVWVRAHLSVPVLATLLPYLLRTHTAAQGRQPVRGTQSDTRRTTRSGAES